MAKGRKLEYCFMNRKSCVYERSVQSALDKTDNSKKLAFVIMPFEKRLDALYHWEIAPFLRANGYTPVRADDVNRIGYIICEKICKQIQEADLVVVDISFHNPNVFYEMGLAMALQKPLLTLCCDDKVKKPVNGKLYKDLIYEKYGIEESKIIDYPKFDKLDLMKNEKIDDRIFSDYEGLRNNKGALLKMNGKKITVLTTGANAPNGAKPENEIDSGDRKFDVRHFEYDFYKFCKTAAGNAIDRIFKDRENAWVDLYNEDETKEILVIDDINLSENNMKDVFEKLAKCSCAIIDITINHNINYFWLGYIHGIGGNVIPINRKKDASPNPARYRQAGGKRENEVAFDIRALWHILFDEADPKSLSVAFMDILKIIYEEKAATRNRDEFWESILTDSEVSIFLGSYYLDKLGRNSIGDWDYRTAAELTSFLTSRKATIKVTLASPLPKKGAMDEPEKKKYIKELENLLIKGKNCIIIASPDVNDLTEVALCKIYGLENPFEKIPLTYNGFKGFIAHKTYNKANFEPSTSTSQEHAFYEVSSEDEDKRGYKYRSGKNEFDPLLEEHKYPGDSTEQINTLLGQLVVAENPVAKGKKIIIISGISGPATFGIAQLLTGGVYDEFTINYLRGAGGGADSNGNRTFPLIAERLERFKASQNNANDQKKFYTVKTDENGEKATDVHVNFEILSEALIMKMTETYKKSNGDGCTAIIEVDVYYPPEEDINAKSEMDKRKKSSKDERKIIAFKYRDLTDMEDKLDNPQKIIPIPNEEQRWR